MRPLHAAATLLLLLLCSGTSAGPWEARSAQGQVLRLEQDSFRTREGYLLTRRYPDGSLDLLFGDQGSTVFSLGPDNEGPAALRLDALGRIWVAGASAGASASRGDAMQAVVLRFGPLGQPDRGYAAAGRSATQPGGRPARALDMAPQADGSAYVAGIITDTAGQERSGWWRLLPDGSVDRGFGLDGLWADSSAGSTEVVGLESSGEGGIRLRLRRGSDRDAPIEEWRLRAGDRMPQRAAAGPAAAGPALGAAASVPAAPPASAVMPAGVPADAAFPAARSAAGGRVGDPWSPSLWLWGGGLFALALALALAWLRWHKRSRSRGRW